MTALAPLADPRAWLGLGGLALLSLGAHWCREWLAIDSCLDLGHVYDYVRATCDHEALHHPVIPYSARHVTVIRVALSVGLVGLVVAVLAALARRTKTMSPTRTLPSSHFALFMVLITMGLAVWALPGTAKLVLLVPSSPRCEYCSSQAQAVPRCGGMTMPQNNGLERTRHCMAEPRRSTQCSTDQEERTRRHSVTYQSGASSESRWIGVIQIFLLPPLATAVGAVVLWLTIGLNSAGIRALEFPRPLQPLFGGLWMLGLMAAGWGAFFAPFFWVGAVAIAVVAARIHGRRIIQQTRLLFLIGLLGICGAWAGLPSLV